MPFLDDAAHRKAAFRWYTQLTTEERFTDFITLLTIMEESVKKNPNSYSRQVDWVNKQKEEIQNSIRKLSAKHDSRTA